MVKTRCICGKKLAIPEEHAGKKLACPECKRIFQLPKAKFQPMPPGPTPRGTPEPIGRAIPAVVGPSISLDEPADLDGQTDSPSGDLLGALVSDAAKARSEPPPRRQTQLDDDNWSADAAEPLPKTAMRACPSCGQVLPKSAVFCIDCGFDLRQNAGIHATRQTGPEGQKSETIGWILVTIPALTTLMIWFWVGNMNLLQNPDSNLFMLGILTVVSTSILMAIEASQLGFGKGGKDQKRDTSPAGWLLGGLLLWIIVFPIYLHARRKYGVASRCLLGLLFALGFVISLGHMSAAIEQHKEQVRGIMRGLPGF